MFRTLALGLALAAASAQNAPETVIRINVNLVQVDAVVTDSKGKPVTDLQAQDFEILQDGKSQAITNFSYITTRPGGTRTVTAPPAKQPRGAPPPPPAVLKASSIRRTIALVVDDLGLSFESTAQIRRSLKKFVDEDMQPGDLVAIIRTGAGMGALQQFTADKRMLYAAIERVKYNGLGRVGVSSFAPLGQDSSEIDTTTFEESREEVFSVGTMGAIRYVVDGLKDLPGRKAVILFSENMRMLYSDGLNQRVLDSVKLLADAANRASVVIHSIDPRGLPTLSLTAADNTRNMTPQQISRVPMQRSQQMFDSQEGMVMLAKETGGLFLHNTNDIDGALRQVVEDGEGYYLIGYHPSASTFDVKTGQPKFHSVKVRVKRSGLQVRSRSGFFGTSDRDQQPVPHTRQTQIARALTSPFNSGALHVRLTTLFSNAAKAGSFINSLIYFEPRELQFTDEPDGWHKAVVDIVAMTFGDNGQAVDSTDKTYNIRLKSPAYEEALTKGLVYSIHHPVKKPGAYQMRVVLRDATAEQVGAASQFIEVPDLDKGRLTLSGILLAKDTPAAVQTGPEHPEGQVADQDPKGTVAVRIFKPGVTLMYGYQILNAQADAEKRAQLEVQTRLFRDGEQVYLGKPAPVGTPIPIDPKRLLGSGRMQLGQKIAPGDYVLQVIVTDKLAKEKYRTATQSMDFEIQP